MYFTNKDRINKRLLIITGPSCSGKSTKKKELEEELSQSHIVNLDNQPNHYFTMEGLMEHHKVGWQRLEEVIFKKQLDRKTITWGSHKQLAIETPYFSKWFSVEKPHHVYDEYCKVTSSNRSPLLLNSDGIFSRIKTMVKQAEEDGFPKVSQ